MYVINFKWIKNRKNKAVQNQIENNRPSQHLTNSCKPEVGKYKLLNCLQDIIGHTDSQLF